MYYTTPFTAKSNVHNNKIVKSTNKLLLIRDNLMDTRSKNIQQLNGGSKMPTIAGHHHISMITKNAQQNVHFYRDKLGLRLVKKTVNQEDPSMHHLFYGDETGSPGTSLTFFAMPYVGSTYRGTNAITRIGLLVKNEEALTYWKKRFEQLVIQHGAFIDYSGKKALPFQDPDGLELLLIDGAGEEIPSFWKTWEKSAVPQNYQILGMGPVEMTAKRPKKLINMLRDLFGYEKVENSEPEKRYKSVLGALYSEIVIKEKDGKTEKPGRGSIDHLAIRVKDVQEMQQWEKKIKERGYSSTDIINRYYFHSLYFRDANGIKFELATDGPGLHIDEQFENLGESLVLPPFLEGKRQDIEAKLTPIE